MELKRDRGAVTHDDRLDATESLAPPPCRPCNLLLQPSARFHSTLPIAHQVCRPCNLLLYASVRFHAMTPLIHLISRPCSLLHTSFPRDSWRVYTR